MQKPIIGANHRSTKIEIVLPVDASGEYAYDEDGKPIRGRQPLVFSVPRFDCMDRDQLKTMNKEWSEIGKRTDDDGNPLSEEDRGTQMVLAMIRQFIPEETLAVVAGLTLFELEQIAERIQEGSKLTVGELLASTNS